MSATRAARRRLRHQLPKIPPSSMVRVGALNVYECAAGHQTVTVDRDAGTTPAFMACPHEEARGWPPVKVSCELEARSAWYRNIPADLVPTQEWFRPDDAERRELSDWQADHVNRGGLLLRPIRRGQR